MLFFVHDSLRRPKAKHCLKRISGNVNVRPRLTMLRCLPQTRVRVLICLEHSSSQGRTLAAKGGEATIFIGVDKCWPEPFSETGEVVA
jgi:hypothetical protein